MEFVNCAICGKPVPKTGTRTKYCFACSNICTYDRTSRMNKKRLKRAENVQKSQSKLAEMSRAAQWLGMNYGELSARLKAGQITKSEIERAAKKQMEKIEKEKEERMREYREWKDAQTGAKRKRNAKH